MSYQPPTMLPIIPSKSGIQSVDRALSILLTFTSKQPILSLHELSLATGMHKSGILRALASLEAAQLIQRTPNDKYRLNHGVLQLSAAFNASCSAETLIRRALKDLVNRTNESAAFYVLHHQQRLCLYREDSSQALRDHITVGDVLPLKCGASGHIFQAYLQMPTPHKDKIFNDNVLTLIGDRVPDLAGIAAPIFDESKKLKGVLTLIVPTHRMDEQFTPTVHQAAQDLNKLLGAIQETEL